MWPFTSSNSLLIASHIQARDALIASAQDKLGLHPSPSEAALEAEILSSDIETITSGILDKKWTSTRVLEAYIRSSIRAQERCRPLTEIYYEQALKRAAWLDAEFQKTGKLVGPLHGVPLSVKEQYALRGTHLTVGFSSWIKSGPTDHTAGIVRLGEHLGAIPFVKTNVPQTMIAIDSRNPLFGQTSNPWNPHNICGGSSGGEAALLGADGSAAGLGSDIGGSLRVPTGFCGIYALKASGGRYPLHGGPAINPGFHAIHVVAGPMARSAKDLEVLHRAYMEALHPSDLSTIGDLSIRQHQKRFGAEAMPHLPLHAKWLDDPLGAAKARNGGKGKLRIGYYVCDGFNRTSPACIRGVLEAVSALQTAHGNDVELVEIPHTDLQIVKSIRIFNGLVSSDAFANFRKHIGTDRTDSALFVMFLVARVPTFLKVLLLSFVRFFLKDPSFAAAGGTAGRKTAGQYTSTEGEKDDFIEAWEERVWEGYTLDGIIAPVFPLPAPVLHGTDEISICASSTFLYNVLDTSVAIVPVTRVDAKVDRATYKDPSPLWGPKAHSDIARAAFKSTSGVLSWRIYSGKKALYNAEQSHGLPVAVQVITRPREDEKALGLMRLVDSALPPMHERGFGPGAYTRWAQKKNI
ncbi:amidase signature enzyme [Ceraceosorus guamensis]|uniref:amidase n=1 Tax=Ceraceosorus guamensis TaxID=1522189 RepID=A0A316W6U8_9BASI|nr:amidase signature enzyme [Ceraceosorus guamensis]PWN43803.1 amidase signature enzyme [Ceraceosorus guamensis]